jgi:hypothetical protein
MRQFKKIFLVFLMVATFIVPSFGTSLIAFADSPIASIGAEITIINMPNTGQINDNLNIPKGSSVDGTVITTIKDPKGAVVFDSSTDTLPDGPDNTYVFSPLLSGVYKVQYSVISADEEVLASTYSNEYKIVVVGDKPVLNFDTNSNILLPNKTNYDCLITIPYPEVVASDGEVVALADVADDISITVKNPSGDTVVLGTTDIESVSYYTFTPLEADGEGVYTIDYYYADAVTGLTARKTVEMVVDSSFNEDNIELSYVLSDSMPESAVLGNEITFPKAVTRDENAGNALINTYVDIKVTFLNPEGEDIIYNLDGFKFTPVNEGDYEIIYTVYNFFGLQTDEALGEYTYNINNVEDTEAPQVQPVANYPEEMMDDNEYNFVNVDYNIPSNVAVGKPVNFPAIHAKDNFSLSSNLNFKRSVINSNNTITDLDHITNNEYDYFEEVPYEFTTEGTYTVRYAATDEAGNERVVSYSLKVVDGFLDNVAPRITMPSIQNYVKLGDTIKFLKPTAIDYVSTESTDTVDKRVEVNTYYYLEEEIEEAVQITEDEEDSDYLSFEVPTGITEEYITIYVEAKDDGPNNASGVNTETDTKIVNILDDTDIVAPSFAGQAPLITAKDQGQVVDLPIVKFTDNNPTFVSVTARVTDPNGNKVIVSGLQLQYELDTLEPNDADGIKVTAGRFTAILAGNYSITYTATDIANNSYVISYTQYINDTQAPSFNIGQVASNLEVGETITLPTPVIMDNGEEIENEALTPIIIVSGPSYDLTLATYEFTPLEEGVYTFKYLAEDESGNTSESATYTVTAKDTIKPTILLNEDFAFPLTAPLTRADENDPYDAISIPDFTPYDEFNGIKNYSVTVKNPSGVTILDAKNGETATGGVYSFVPTKDGSYTVTYSATDLAGNVTTDTRTVKVGDTAAPVLTIGNTEANKPGNKKINSTITLDLDAIEIEDNKDGEILKTHTTSTGDKKFNVVLKAPDGSTVSEVAEGSYSYNLSQAGDYTLTYTVRDDAGNERVESTVFQVTADEAGTTVLTQTLGIIFILIALAVLAGVVIYFVRSREIIED